MLFGAIDVGTNSIHLIVVEFEEGLASARVVYKAREMVRLGSGDALARGELDPQSIERGVVAIARFVDSARARGADHIRAVATSAVREASNAERFVRAVEQVTGVRVEVLGELDEARLIYEGVAGGFPIYDRVVCILDIGGGSTEFIVADAHRPHALESVRLGSLRLYDAFLRGHDDQRVAAGPMIEEIRRVLAPVLARLTEYDFDLVVGTSGTVMGLAALDAHAHGQPVSRVHGYELRLDRLRDIQAEMLEMTEAERKRMPGMNVRRADIIVAGNAVLIEALSGLRANSLIVSERALRDGIVAEFIESERKSDILVDATTLRRRAIEMLAKRYQSGGMHERQVASLALLLFDRLSVLHGLDSSDRELLYAAAIAHDIGRYVNPSAHHKHGAYLVRNSPLAEWQPRELEIIASVVRYHRKALPKPTHFEVVTASPEERRRVEALASLLRIADGLDARHLGAVYGLEIEWRARTLVILVQADQDVSSELAGATFKADLFERTFGTRIQFEPATMRERV
ncbi:MAG TPA: Ppx/GppA phosphatase family protein [Candidatus Binatia bacterium]|nr:Ppx/GppA phosphatase family protein [Candidatus Binatia bacterium]